MTSNQDIINKAGGLSSADFVGTRLLKPVEVQAVISNMVDSSALLKNVRVVPMDAPSMAIPKTGLAGRVLRPGIALTDPGNTITPSYGDVLLNTQEVVAATTISDNVGEDLINNGGPDAYGDKLFGDVAVAAGNETEDATINGRVWQSSGGTAPRHINSLYDGVLQRALAAGTNVVDASTGFASRQLSFTAGDDKIMSAIYKLADKYTRDLTKLRLYVPSTLALNYASLQMGITGMQAGVLSGQTVATYMGIPVVPCPLIKRDGIVSATATTTTTLAADAQADSLTITVASATGLVAGNNIIIGWNLLSAETRTIASVSGNVITLTVPLALDHAGTGTAETVKLYSAIVNDGTFAILTMPDNIIVGVQRTMRIAKQYNARVRGTDWVLSMRMAVGVEDINAVVLIKNLAARTY